MNHGSKPAMTVHDALIIQQLHYDLVRITRTNFNTIFNDEDGCYDRIRGNLLSIACQRRGLPKNIVVTPVKTMNNMEHLVRTAYGISKGKISPHQLRGGIGQGGGWGPLGWDSLLDPLVEALQNHSDGCLFSSPDLKTLYRSWVATFVDDCQVYINQFKNDTLKHQIEQFIKAILSWQRLLRLTGGDLSLDKCLAYIV